MEFQGAYIVEVLKEGYARPEGYPGPLVKVETGSKFVVYVLDSVLYWPFHKLVSQKEDVGTAGRFLPYRSPFLAEKTNDHFQWTKITSANVNEVHELVISSNSDPKALVHVDQACFFLYGSADDKFKQRAINVCIKGKPDERTTHDDAIVSNLIDKPELARDLDLDVKIDIVNTLGTKLANVKVDNVQNALTVFELLKPDITQAAKLVEAAELVIDFQESLSERLMEHTKKEFDALSNTQYTD